MNIFGGNTGVSYEDVQRKRKLAEQLISQSASAPKNVGEGLHAIGQALAARSLNKRADKTMADNPHLANIQGLRDVAGSRPSAAVIEALMGGAPNFKRGGRMPHNGQAVVGEEGPEVITLPKGAQIQPMTPEMLQQYDPASQERLRNNPDDMQAPPADWREMRDNSSFTGEQYQTADMSGIEPSGVGEKSQLHGTARSFQGFMKSLDDYEATFNDGGSTMWPGERKDQLSIAHRDLQMQMKELYNLGVLNGPDLGIMNQILIDPTSASGNIMDALGIADMEKRVPANIAQVRDMMTNRSTPALQQLGIDPQSLLPKPKSDVSGLSDDDLLKALQGGG